MTRTFNTRMVFRTMGALLLIEAVFMTLALGVSLWYSEADSHIFLLSTIVTLLSGIVGLLVGRRAESRMGEREGYVIVAMVWVVFSAFGLLPYYLSGQVPSFTDAWFESMSGFTTTGATIIPDLNCITHGLLFWRSLTQWIGGMGIIVLSIAILPIFGLNGMQLYAAEVTGLTYEKLSPRIADTAKMMWSIYVMLTASEILGLWLCGMPIFDAICHSFSTIATGGFSTRNASIAAFGSLTIEWIIIIFMFLSGINFSLLYMALRRRFKDSLQSEELWFYIGSAVAATALITLDLVRETGVTVMDALSKASFQSVTIMTTTGFATSDFAAWPAVSQCVLILLMLMGGCAGSTAGGMKCIRFLLLFKNTRRWLHSILHPREVRPICVDGRRTEEDTVSNIACFFFAYMMILMTCTMIIGLDKVNFLEAFSAALTALSNVGPALGILGPASNFAALNTFSKLTMSAAMLLGRLEIVPLAILLMPSVWRRK